MKGPGLSEAIWLRRFGLGSGFWKARGVPPKLRELISELEKAGFVDRGGMGSHRNFIHPDVSRPVTLSGKPGDDAKRYQIRVLSSSR